MTAMGGIAAPPRRWGPPLATRRAPLVVAWATAAAASLLAVAGLVLHLIDGGSEITSWWYGNAALALALTPTGALILARRPGNAVGRLMCVSGASSAVCCLGREYLVYGLLGHSAPGWMWVGWLGDSLYVVSMVALPVILMLLPGGLPMSRRAARLLWLPPLALVGTTIDFLFSADPIDVRGRHLTSPSPIRLPTVVTDIASTVGTLLFFASLVAGVVVVVVRYRRAGGEVREQLAWIVWAGSIALVELGTELIPDNPIAPVTGTVTVLFMTAAIAVAILRRGMFDVDVVINRTLVFGVLTVLVVVAYVGVVSVLDAAAGHPVRLGPGAVATALVAAAFAPARSRVQRGVDRLLYGERTNPYGVLTQLGHRMETGEQRGELAIVVDTVTQALKLPYAAIVDPAGRTLAESGHRRGDVVAIPLAYRGEAAGSLLVGARVGGDRLGPPEQRLLADLSGQVGVAVHAVRLAAELQDSRRRLVTAKEEERRRLRRDLHDGLGPKLAAIGLKLDVARTLVDDRPHDSKAAMTAVKDDIRSTLDDIRRLVYGLRPPTLDELGLVGAVREAAGRLDARDGAGLVITVRAPSELPGLPAAVEVAAFWIVNEAMTNVVRHAGAARCDVEIALDGDLVVTVADDGRGLSDRGRPGVGTVSMAERADEVGGSLTVATRTSGVGTEVRARLPLGTGDTDG